MMSKIETLFFCINISKLKILKNRKIYSKIFLLKKTIEFKAKLILSLNNALSQYT